MLNLPHRSRHEERCPQQQAGKEQQQQHAEQNPQAGSSQNMDALLAAVEQAGAEPALQADAPAAAATEDSMAAAAAAPRLAAPGSSPVLAAHAAQAWQRQVDQALLAFEAGDRRSPESMLRPLRLLALVGNGGALLQVGALSCMCACASSFGAVGGKQLGLVAVP